MSIVLLGFIVPADANIRQIFVVFRKKTSVRRKFFWIFVLRPGDSGFHGCANGNHPAGFVGSLIGVRAFALQESTLPMSNSKMRMMKAELSILWRKIAVLQAGEARQHWPAFQFPILRRLLMLKTKTYNQPE
jgi:hypothetical protein